MMHRHIYQVLIILKIIINFLKTLDFILIYYLYGHSNKEEPIMYLKCNMYHINTLSIIIYYKVLENGSYPRQFYIAKSFHGMVPCHHLQFSTAILQEQEQATMRFSHRPQQHLHPIQFLVLASRICCRLGTRKPYVANREFQKYFGVQPVVCSDLWRIAPFPAGTQPIHLLWALMFLWTYPTEPVICSLLGVSEKTFRKRAWPVIERIATASSSVVSHGSSLLCAVHQTISLNYLSDTSTQSLSQ